MAVLDLLYPQQTAARWGERRTEPEPAVLPVAVSRLAGELERVADAGADMVLIDTPPQWAGSDTAARVTARAAGLLVVPAIVDLEATVATIERLRSVTAAPVVSVLNGCAARGRDADDAEEALVDRGVEVCPVRLGQRVVFARSLYTGQVAQELPDEKAADEIERVRAALSVHSMHTREAAA